MADAAPAEGSVGGVTHFDEVTSVTDGPADGTFTAEIDLGWSVGDKPNGGYLLAIMARAASRMAVAAGRPHRDPLTASASYLRAPSGGPAIVQAEVLRSGRSASQVRTTLFQQDRRCVEATFTLGQLRPGSAPWWSDVPAAEVPPEDACFLLEADRPGAPFEVPLMRQLLIRLDPAVAGFASGRPGRGGELRGWLRFADGRDFDPLSLLLAADALPPATFELAPTGWVPTIQLTVYLRAVAAPGPLVVRQRARLVEDGLVDETCDVWDATGRFVAQAVQLAQIRLPAEATGP